MEIRRATVADGLQIHALITHFANQELMLPRPLLNIYENIRDFHPDKQVVLTSPGLPLSW